MILFRVATRVLGMALAMFVFAVSAARAQSGSGQSGASKPAKPAASDLLARGKYLVDIMSCNDCHTPLKMGSNGPEPDMSRMLSGHPESMKLPPAPAPAGPWIWSGIGTNSAFAGPWGVSYAANLTPDHNTGLGIWTEDLFVKAMRTGKHIGTSRPIQPPMPWQWVGKATDADLKAIFAYLKSVPPIVNHVPEYQEPAASAAPSSPAGSPKKPAAPPKK